MHASLQALEAVSPNGNLSHAPAKHCFTSRSKCFLQVGDDAAALKDAEASLKDDPVFIKVAPLLAVLQCMRVLDSC